MKIKELQTLLDSQPSVTKTTYFVFILWGLSWLLFIGFLGLAFGLLLESWFHYQTFLDFVLQKTGLKITLTDGQRRNFATSFGLISLALSLIFLGTIFLCRMILQRNRFILQMEDWIYANLTEINRKAAAKRSSKK